MMMKMNMKKILKFIKMIVKNWVIFLILSKNNKRSLITMILAILQKVKNIIQFQITRIINNKTNKQVISLYK
jgi:hypothetical protein